jgi:hypothetical protein
MVLQTNRFKIKHVWSALLMRRLTFMWTAPVPVEALAAWSKGTVNRSMASPGGEEFEWLTQLAIPKGMSRKYYASTSSKLNVLTK